MIFNKAQVHSVQISGEQRRLLTAGSGANFHNGVFRVIRIARHQQIFERRARIDKLRLGVLKFLLNLGHDEETALLPPNRQLLDNPLSNLVHSLLRNARLSRSKAINCSNVME